MTKYDPGAILAGVRIVDLNWMQLEAHLERDDRIVLPLGSVEQHAYLSLGVDVILSQRVAEEAAEPLGVPVLPSLPYGITPYFGAFPGSPTVSAEVYGALLKDLVGSLHAQGFKRVLLVNGHGGNAPGRPVVEALDAGDAQVRWHDWWSAPRTKAAIEAIDPDAAHASWMENFPWTRLEGIDQPRDHKPKIDIVPLRPRPPAEVREIIGDGSLGGDYERPDEEMLRVWAIGVEETRERLERGWRG
jgi:creatinine amidohydrolase